MSPVRWSFLRYMAKSPAHYLYALNNPPDETAPMRIGAYTHQIVLGGSRKFAVYDGDRRGKVWAEFKEANGDAEILTRTEADLANGAADAVLSHKVARRHLDGYRERTFAWTVAGRACAGTPDAHGDSWVTDLKVTPDASPFRFPWHARRMMWDAQLAWYAHGLGLDAPALHLVAVEAKPPHIVQVYSLTVSAIEAARKRWRGLFEQLMVCEASGDWPGYCETVLPFESVDDAVLEIDGEEVIL